MEYRNFYLSCRKLKTGKKMYYFYVRNADGSRSVPHSTGKRRKNEAIKYCEDLLSSGRLDKSDVTIKSFSKNFFSKDGIWVKSNQDKGLSKNTISNYEYSLKNNILPFLGEYRISRITPNVIRQWIFELKNSKGMYESSIKVNSGVLNIILNSAVEERILNRNPMEFVRIKGISSKTRRAFTLFELVKVLNNLKSSSHTLLACYISALTGLRLGEVLGLERKNIYKNFIDVSQQHTVFGEITRPKTKMSRYVTIPRKLSILLENILKKSSSNFLFDNGKGKILSNSTIQSAFLRYFAKIKIQRDQKLSFHSLRHFFNTYLTENDISDRKIKTIMGHSSGLGSMTERYTTWKPSMFNDVLKIQNELCDNLANLLDVDTKKNCFYNLFLFVILFSINCLKCVYKVFTIFLISTFLHLHLIFQKFFKLIIIKTHIFFCKSVI